MQEFLKTEKAYWSSWDPQVYKKNHALYGKMRNIIFRSLRRRKREARMRRRKKRKRFKREKSSIWKKAGDHL